MLLDIGIVALLLFGVYAFATMVGWRTRGLSRRTDRRAEDMYDQYGGPTRRQRRQAGEHRAGHPGRFGAKNVNRTRP